MKNYMFSSVIFFLFVTISFSQETTETPNLQGNTPCGGSWGSWSQCDRSCSRNSQQCGTSVKTRTFQYNRNNAISLGCDSAEIEEEDCSECPRYVDACDDSCQHISSDCDEGCDQDCEDGCDIESDCDHNCDMSSDMSCDGSCDYKTSCDEDCETGCDDDCDYVDQCDSACDRNCIYDEMTQGGSANDGIDAGCDTATLMGTLVMGAAMAGGGASLE
jgi:hypothetical protein